MPKSILSRFPLMVIAVIIASSLTGCGISRHSEREKTNSSSDQEDYIDLVMNDFPLLEEQYIVETIGDSTYILLDSEIITYNLKLPYVSDPTPELSTQNGQITIYWTHQNQIALRVDMVEGSNEAYINDSNEPLDIVVGPKTINDKLFIPINLFLSALEMEETYDENLDITFLHYTKDFPADLIHGRWSDSDTDIFTVFEDVSSGLKGLSSFSSAYQFNTDGTYRSFLISGGGFIDTAVQCKGKYRILGNTIIYYDATETLYEGRPLFLSYKDKKLSKPSYEFIGNYDANEDRIKIGAFWHHRVGQ